MIKPIIHIIYCLIFVSISFNVMSQGLYNNGAGIYISSGTTIYIDGDASGAYQNETNTSNGEVDSDGTIIIEGNWTNNASNNVFINRDVDGIVSFRGSTTQIIGGSTKTIFEDMEIDNINGAQLGITDNTISDIFTLTNGALDLNSKTIIIDNSATTATVRTNGYILSSVLDQTFSSKVQWNIGAITGDHIFPFGLNATTYIPFYFSPNSGTIGDVTISTYPSYGSDASLVYADKPSDVTNLDGTAGIGDPGNAGYIVKRFWSISTSGTGNANILFTYATAEEPIEGEGTMFAQRYNDITDIWDQALTGQTGNTTTNTVNVPGVNQFSIWILSKENNPLPVELLDYRTRCKNENVEISWSTATEANNDYFTIEKSIDGISFSKLALVNGAGNSNAILHYSYKDYDLSNEKHYYRLKQTDFDGQFEYSNIIFAECGETEENDFGVYPNPANKILTINFNSDLNLDYKYDIIDCLGRKIISGIFKKGGRKFTLELNNKIHSGMYILSIYNKNNQLNRIIIKE